MDADDVSDAVDNGEVFEPVGVQDDGCVVVGLGTVERGVDHLERADELAFVDLVGEGSIDDNTVDVGLGATLGEGDVSELGVAVTLSGGFLGGGFGGDLGTSHCVSVI